MNLSKTVVLRLLFVAILSFAAVVPALRAQEGEPVVIDEVIAQVNDGVITLSRVKREMKQAIEGLVQQGKTPEEAQREVEKRRSEMIASLINEELLIQQGKEMNLEREVEERVNQHFVGIMQRENIKSLDELYKRMRAESVEPDDIKAVLRKQIMPEMVFRNDVDSKIYFGLTSQELKDYFEKNKDKFRRPETVTLSEIFLSFAGRNEADVRAKAADLVKQARGGASFDSLVAANSEREGSKKNKGKLGTFELKQLQEGEPRAVEAIKNLKAGQVSDPVQLDEGLMILRVDERTADNAAPAFDENRVRERVTAERQPAERKKYLANLRQDAYIKISDTYQAAVKPLLDKGETSN